MILRLFICVAIGSLICAPSISLAGPDWVEETDAGSLPPTSQAPKGNGPISSIAGSLLAVTAAGGADMEDMYTIFIHDPANFVAQTTITGSATFDTQLWLFNVNQRAVLANDDITFGQPGSRISSPANDGTGQTISAPGVFFLAVTGYNNDPVNAFNSALFNQATRIEISGPDGPAGSFPIAGWGTSNESGTYVIRLTGASFPPGDCDEDLVYDPDDNDIDDDGISNSADTCDYTPLVAAPWVITERGHPLYGSLACDIDGDCDCDLDDFAEFERVFTGVGCANGEPVTDSACPVIPEPPTRPSK